MGKLTAALLLYMASPPRRQSVQSDAFFWPGSWLYAWIDGQTDRWLGCDRLSSSLVALFSSYSSSSSVAFNDYFCICVSIALLEWTFTSQSSPLAHTSGGSFCFRAIEACHLKYAAQYANTFFNMDIMMSKIKRPTFIYNQHFIYCMSIHLYFEAFQSGSFSHFNDCWNRVVFTFNKKSLFERLTDIPDFLSQAHGCVLSILLFLAWHWNAEKHKIIHYLWKGKNTVNIVVSCPTT